MRADKHDDHDPFTSVYICLIHRGCGLYLFVSHPSQTLFGFGNPQTSNSSVQLKVMRQSGVGGLLLPALLSLQGTDAESHEWLVGPLASIRDSVSFHSTLEL